MPNAAKPPGSDDDDKTDHGLQTADPADAALDAAWRDLDAGDVAGARNRVARLSQDTPEVLFLLAACCREENEPSQALALLRRAVTADPEWASPELWIAELLAADPDTLEQAIGHAERAVDLADEEGEYLSALALKAALEIELGDLDDACQTLEDLPPPDVAIDDPDAALEIADLFMAVGDTEQARARLRTLTAAMPDSADGWYALGCVAADLDDEQEMRTAWKRTWSLDAAPANAAARPPRPLTEMEVGAVAERALEELPPRARELLRDVPVVIAELPAEADVDAGIDPRALGLFSGTAYPEATHLGGQPGLTQILIFRRNLERVAGTEEELRDEIRTTLLHETGHFFGMDHAALEGAGLG